MDILKKWQFWVAVAIVIALIVCIILFFTNRTFAYVASSGLIGLLVGFIAGYVIWRKYPVEGK